VPLRKTPPASSCPPPSGGLPDEAVLLRRWLLEGVAVVAVAGLGAEIGYFKLGLPAPATELLSLSEEHNLPTWVASCLLFSCGALLAAIARRVIRRRGPFRAHWVVLAALFLYMSLDEAIELHESLGGLIDAGGVLYFSWVIPAAVFVGAVGLSYVPFLRHLPPATRRRFIIAGAIYVGGALVMELPLGWWTEAHGDDNLTYALIDWVEETLELVGASLFLVALRAELMQASTPPDP